MRWLDDSRVITFGQRPHFLEVEVGFVHVINGYVVLRASPLAEITRRIFRCISIDGLPFTMRYANSASLVAPSVVDKPGMEHEKLKDKKSPRSFRLRAKSNSRRVGGDRFTILLACREVRFRIHMTHIHVLNIRHT